MYRPVVRLELYKIIGGNESSGYIYSETPEIITEFNSLTTTFGIEKRKDTIKFNIDNQNILFGSKNNFNNYKIGSKDVLKLYAYNAPMTGVLADHLIMIAYVKSFSYDSTEGSAKISYTANNRSEVLLNSFMFAPYNTPQKVPFMIVESINRIKIFNTNDSIHAYKDYSGLSDPGTKGAYDENGVAVSGYTGYIRAYKAAAYNTDGTLKFTSPETVPTTLDDDGNSLYYFDDSTFSETYKPFIDHLEILSTPKYTGDENVGTYINFVDDDNNLHWEPKTFTNVNSSTGALNILREYEGPSTTIDQDNDEVINAVIVNCGADPQEMGILTLAYNASSMGKYGAKWKYLAKTDIADSIREAEYKSGAYTNIEGVTVTDGQNYPAYLGDDNYPSSYPWIIQTGGTDEFGAWEYEAKVDDVNSNPEYKTYFRNICIAEGKKQGLNTVNYQNEPLKKFKYELEQGSLNYVAGDMVQIIIPSIGILETNTNLVRIMSVTHTFQGSRWTTLLELEEDMDYRILI